MRNLPIKIIQNQGEAWKYLQYLMVYLQFFDGFIVLYPSFIRFWDWSNLTPLWSNCIIGFARKIADSFSYWDIPLHCIPTISHFKSVKHI